MRAPECCREGTRTAQASGSERGTSRPAARSKQATLPTILTHCAVKYAAGRDFPRSEPERRDSDPEGQGRAEGNKPYPLAKEQKLRSHFGHFCNKGLLDRFCQQVENS